VERFWFDDWNCPAYRWNRFFRIDAACPALGLIAPAAMAVLVVTLFLILVGSNHRLKKDGSL